MSKPIYYATLVGLSGFYAYKTIDIYINDHICFGRNRNICSILYPPNSTKISGVHCELYFNKKKFSFVLMDKESKNGTFILNEDKLIPGEEYELHHGSRFYLSNTENTFALQINDARAMFYV